MKDGSLSTITTKDPFLCTVFVATLVKLRRDVCDALLANEEGVVDDTTAKCP